MGVAGPDRLQAWCGGIELYCKAGVSKPAAATKGYFTLPEDPARETTREDQQPCDAGYYCTGGAPTAPAAADASPVGPPE